MSEQKSPFIAVIAYEAFLQQKKLATHTHS